MNVDGGAILAAILGVGGLTNAVQFLVWYTTRRSVENQDREVSALKDRVRDLDQDKVAGLQRQINMAAESGNARHEAHAEGRRGLHRDLLGKVNLEDCYRAHVALNAKVDQLPSIAVDLARVEEKTRETANRIEHVNEEQIALMRDLENLKGSLKR